MTDPVQAFRPWVVYAGAVLTVAVLYWAQAVLVPLAVAVLLTFLLSPIATTLQRAIGRVPAVLAVAALTFALLGTAGWAVTRQLTRLTDDLPLYRDHILQKIADVRGASQGESVEMIQQTIKEIQSEMGATAPAAAPAAAVNPPVVVTPEPAADLWSFPDWVGPFLEPLATAALVVILVIFMLLERQDLRDRLIGLIGAGHVPVTTKALDEAASRVSAYLLRQTLVNTVFGVGVAVGLSLIGVPYFLLWAAMAAVLRFIPYVGPWIGAGAPILVSLAALDGWERPLLVVALFAGLELFTNLVLETYFYAGAAGVSQVGLLVSVAFWTWLWGPLGLLIATPLTVCLVVLGKHVSGFGFIATLIADAPALPPDVSFYQRLLARDQNEAAELIERHLTNERPESVYDALLLPALNYAERDRLDQRLSAELEHGVIESTRELMADVAQLSRSARARAGDRPERRLTVIGYPANAEADELALRMLAESLADTPVAVEIAPARMLANDLVALIQQRGDPIVCIVDLPPSAASKSRYLVRKLRAAAPAARIVVGRWAPVTVAEFEPRPLVEGGANYVAATLLETRAQLLELAQHVLGQTPESTRVGAA